MPIRQSAQTIWKLDVKVSPEAPCPRSQRMWLVIDASYTCFIVMMFVGVIDFDVTVSRICP